MRESDLRLRIRLKDDCIEDWTVSAARGLPQWWSETSNPNQYIVNLVRTEKVDKCYLVKDHMGNLISTFSDKKEAHAFAVWRANSLSLCPHSVEELVIFIK